FSIADNAQAYISGSAANSSTNKGVVTDTKTALTGGRSYLSVQNGGTEQWSFNNDTSDGTKQILACTTGTVAQIYGNAALSIGNSSSYLHGMPDSSGNLAALDFTQTYTASQNVASVALSDA